MRKYFLLFSAVFVLVMIIAQEKLHLLKPDGSATVFNVSEIDSIAFHEQQSELIVYKKDLSNETFQLSDLTEMYFSGIQDTIQINFNGATAEVFNPMSGKGVDITVSGADVVIQSAFTENELVYLVQGNSTDGSLKIYSDYRFMLMLNGLDLVNKDGPAINIQSSKHVSVVNVAGKINVLADAAVYTASTEDQKATFFSEGQLIFSGEGSLNVSSLAAHAICSDDYLTINDGQINVTTAAKDALHCNDKILMHGGIVQLKSSDDGIDCEDGHFTMTGGVLNIQLTGVNVNGIDTDSTLTIKGGELSVTLTGLESKALKCNGAFTMENGTVNLSSADDGVKSETSIVIKGGNLNILNSKEGIESKYISFEGGITRVNASDDAINGTMGTVVNGAESNDGSNVYVKDGYLFAKISSNNGGDAIDSNGNLYLNGGTVVAIGPNSGANEDFDVNGTFAGNGGTVIGATSSSNMNETWNTASTQYSLYLKSTTALAVNVIFRIQDAAGNEILSFKNTVRSSYGFHFSSPLLKTGTSYSIYTGGTYTGGTVVDGVCNGGTYAGGTLKKTFTITSKSTTISF